MMIGQMNVGDIEYQRVNFSTIIRERLEILLNKGNNVDIDALESIREWMNEVFTELESFPSEHRTFRLHCLHTGLTLLSIASDKAGEDERI